MTPFLKSQADNPLNLRHGISRRRMLAGCGGLAAVGCSTAFVKELQSHPPLNAMDKPKYLLASSMYGFKPLAEILPEVHKTGATSIDLWPKVHGNQREQVTEMGEAAFRGLLDQHDVSLGCITQYPLGPFKLASEMQFAKRFNCPTMVTGGQGPRNLSGQDLKSAVAHFCEQLKPHLALAEASGVTLAIENHANNLIDSADSLRWLKEFAPSRHLGIALAPYHLPQDAQQLAKLIRELGDSIQVFYAWQHGMGSMQAQPKAQELLQMPGRGELDFKPIVEALADINYQNWVSIFMHPFPRGIPILEETQEVTQEIVRAREYLASCNPAVQAGGN